MLKTFAESPKGYQLNFLLNHDNTGYKLCDDIKDLTHLQIHFMFICAKKQQEEIDKATNTNSKVGKSKTPLSITNSDSREDIEDKLGVIKNTFF